MSSGEEGENVEPQFITDAISDLQCAICFCPVKNPVRCTNHHLFCRDCIDRWKHGSPSPPSSSSPDQPDAAAAAAAAAAVAAPSQLTTSTYLNVRFSFETRNLDAADAAAVNLVWGAAAQGDNKLNEEIARLMCGLRDAADVTTKQSSETTIAAIKAAVESLQFIRQASASPAGGGGGGGKEEEEDTAEDDEAASTAGSAGPETGNMPRATCSTAADCLLQVRAETKAVRLSAADLRRCVDQLESQLETRLNAAMTFAEIMFRRYRYEGLLDAVKHPSFGRLWNFDGTDVKTEMTQDSQQDTFSIRLVVNTSTGDVAEATERVAFLLERSYNIAQNKAADCFGGVDINASRLAVVTVLTAVDQLDRSLDSLDDKIAAAESDVDDDSSKATTAPRRALDVLVAANDVHLKARLAENGVATAVQKVKDLSRAVVVGSLPRMSEDGDALTLLLADPTAPDRGCPVCRHVGDYVQSPDADLALSELLVRCPVVDPELGSCVWEGRYVDFEGHVHRLESVEEIGREAAGLRKRPSKRRREDDDELPVQLQQPNKKHSPTAEFE